MWNFWRKAAVAPVSEPVSLCLAREHGLTSQALASLCMVEQRGRYSGRKVTYVRVFDRIAVETVGIDLRHFGGLASRRLLLYYGHIEKHGKIVLERRPSLHVAEQLASL